MKFEEALAAMREGKKVRLNYWEKESFIYLKDDHFINGCSGDTYVMITSAIISDEWEIYEEPKWEPERGMYLASSLGVRKLEYDEDLSPEALSYGLYRTTLEQAEAARDKMRTFNRLLAYVDEHSEEGEKRDYVVYCGSERYHYIEEGEEHDLGAVLMSKRVAEILCNDLNSGMVVL